ncbi:vitamin B6 photo-protection and homoeostasis-domain-containing protein [Chytridium lagenaria]|nr:vitamin B6 photo-protection and homoeostasis-domain-containing protein [Chytridium lagenaria]
MILEESTTREHHALVQSTKGQLRWVSSPIHARKGIVQFLKEAFLPDGYPHSVSKDYTSYQIFDTLQAFCSNVTGLLATRATFQRLGVGDSAATPLAATLTWVLKDGTGMISTILYAWLFSFDIDANTKRWRFFADIFNDAGTFMEVLAPSLPRELFLPIVCLATVFKGLCGVAAGATKAALSQHFAVHDNVADLNAKDGSQETIVGLVGMLIGSYIVQWVSGTFSTWLCFLIFTALHLVFNYFAVRSVVLPTLNTQRAFILISQYIKTQKVMSLETIAKREKLVWRSPSWIRMGVSLLEIVEIWQPKEGVTKDLIDNLISNPHHPTYTLFSASPIRSITSSPPHPLILISFRKNVTSIDILRAYFHALHLSFSPHDTNEADILISFRIFMDDARKAGWIIDHAARNRIHTGEWRWSVKERRD